MTFRACVVKGLPDQVHPTTRTLLEGKGWVECPSAVTGALTLADHTQAPLALRTPVRGQKNLKVVILHKFPEG